MRDNSFIAFENALFAIISVQMDCMGVRDLSLFSSKGAQLTSHGFAEKQSAHLNNAASKLKEEWTHRIRKSIRNNLVGTGIEGWSPEMQSISAYETSHIARLLKRCNLVMGDMLRDIIEDNLEAYVLFIERITAYDAEVKSILDVRVTEVDGGKEVPDIHEPYFKLSLCQFDPRKENEAMEDGASKADEEGDEEEEDEDEDEEDANLEEEDLSIKVVYDQDTAAFAQNAVDAVDAILQSLKSVSQIQHLVMSRMYWEEEAMVPSVLSSEDSVKKCQSAVRSAIERTLPALDDYLKLFASYSEILSLDINEYVQGIKASYSLEDGHGEFGADAPKDQAEENGDKKEEGDDDDDEDIDRKPFDVAAVAGLIKKHSDAHTKTFESIPESISLGVFTVDCSDIRLAVANKHKDIVALLLNYVRDRLNNSTLWMLREFDTINKSLSRFPQNIEDLVEVQEYMASVPATMKVLEEKIADMKKSFDLLEKHHVQLSEGEFSQKWSSFGGPKSVADKMASTDKVLKEKAALR